MRAVVMAAWVVLTLCCALACARQDVQDDKLSRGQVQVREHRGLVEPKRRLEEGDVEMSDEPVGAVQEEKGKPKKKKTPEEIEEARAKKAAEKEAKAKKQKGPKPTKKPKAPKPTKKPKAPKPTKKPKAPKATKKPKEVTTVRLTTERSPVEDKKVLEDLGWDTVFEPVTTKKPAGTTESDRVFEPTTTSRPVWTEPIEPDLDLRGKKQVTTPEVIMYIPEETTSIPYVGPWYEEYDYADLAAKKQEEEEERARKEKAEKGLCFTQNQH